MPVMMTRFLRLLTRENVHVRFHVFLLDGAPLILGDVVIARQVVGATEPKVARPLRREVGVVAGVVKIVERALVHVADALARRVSRVGGPGGGRAAGLLPEDAPRLAADRPVFQRCGMRRDAL